jgi:hypothetical protein
MIYGGVEILYDASTFSLSMIVRYESEFHLDCLLHKSILFGYLFLA